MGNSKLKSPFVLAMRVQQSDSTEYNSCLLPETKDETFRGGMRQPYGRALVSPASDAAKLRNFVINENFLVGKRYILQLLFPEQNFHASHSALTTSRYTSFFSI